MAMQGDAYSRHSKLDMKKPRPPCQTAYQPSWTLPLMLQQPRWKRGEVGNEEVDASQRTQQQRCQRTGFKGRFQLDSCETVPATVPAGVPQAKKGDHDGRPFSIYNLPFGSGDRASTPLSRCALRSGQYWI
jgi:hypothetical protein